MSDLPRVFVRGGVVAVPSELLSCDEVAEDEASLAVPNPARIAAVRSDDPRAFRIPETISSLVVQGGFALYPIAAAQVYRPRLRSKAFELVDERVRLPAIPVAYKGELLAYQARAVAALAAAPVGCAFAACGAGKGEIIVALVGELGLTSLVCVGQIDHAVDLRERLQRRLGIAVGLIGAGERTIERVTVAIMQALDEATVEEIAPIFELVFRDEGHHSAAESELAVWRRLRARRWYVCTATPRTDGLQPFVHAFFGPVVAEVTREELVEAGRAVDPEIREVPTEFRAPYSGPRDWPRLLDALEADEHRLAQVVETVVREGAGEVSAVLTGRIEHAERIGKALRERGLRVEVLSSRRSKKDRGAALEAARRLELDVLIGTQLLDEGVDVAPLSRVFLVWPAKAEGRLVQRIGRALRPLPGKARPLIFDFVDQHVGVLRHQGRVRRGVFEKHWPSRSRRAA